MVEIRQREYYKSGTDTPELDHTESYDVSDEEMEMEQAEQTVAALSALANEVLKVPQVGRFLKALAKLRR